MWEYEGGNKTLFPSQEIAEANGVDLADAVDVSHATLSQVPSAPPHALTVDDPIDEADEDDPLSIDDTLDGAQARGIVAIGKFTIGDVTHCPKQGSTVRNAGGKYAIGHCYNGASATLTGINYSSKTNPRVPYFKAAIGGNAHRCGFIQTTGNLRTNGTRSSRPCGYIGINENEFASEVFDEDQQQYIKPEKTCVRYRNVNLTSDGPGEDPVRNKDGQIMTVGRGVRMLVRYRTKAKGGDGYWFMTRTPKHDDRSNADEDKIAPWSFVRHDCFNHKPNHARKPLRQPGKAPLAKP